MDLLMCTNLNSAWVDVRDITVDVGVNVLDVVEIVEVGEVGEVGETV